MTTAELRQSQDFKSAFGKIEKYRQGFTFTIKYAGIPTAKLNALRILLRDAKEAGLIKSISVGMGFLEDGSFDEVEETFVRL